MKASRSLSWLWGDLSQQEGSGYLVPAIRPLPLHLLQLFSSAVLAVNTPAGLPLSLPVLYSHTQNTTKYTHQAAQGWESYRGEVWQLEICSVCQMQQCLWTAHLHCTFVCICVWMCKKLHLHLSARICDWILFFLYSLCVQCLMSTSVKKKEFELKYKSK